VCKCKQQPDKYQLRRPLDGWPLCLVWQQTLDLLQVQVLLLLLLSLRAHRQIHTVQQLS
jgi:hypothetical protein